MSANNFFDELVGQTAVKSQLQFYIAASRNNGGVMPPIMFGGPKGHGKTQFARATAANLKRPYAELNCGSIKNARQFFEGFILNTVHDKDVTVLLDECHHLPKDVVTSLLTILNTEKSSRKEFTFQDYTFEFDFARQSFMLATTETDKVFGPLKDRMTLVDFSEYSDEELKTIIKKRLKDVKFQAGVLTEIATTVRNNPRFAVQRCKEIRSWCDMEKTDEFGVKAWADLKKRIDIKPLGLTKSEVMILGLLNTRGGMTLNGLAAATQQSRQAIQRDVESYLMRQGLLRIEGLRYITPKGQDVLHEIEG